MQVSKPTPGGGAPFGIDLEAGVAKITLRRPAGEPDPAEAAPTENDAADADPSAPGAPAAGDGEKPAR